MKAIRFLIASAFGAILALPAATAQAQTVQINGAGATFPYPVYSQWAVNSARGKHTAAIELTARCSNHY